MITARCPDCGLLYRAGTDHDCLARRKPEKPKRVGNKPKRTNSVGNSKAVGNADDDAAAKRRDRQARYRDKDREAYNAARREQMRRRRAAEKGVSP